jgi:hypothetical protein
LQTQGKKSKRKRSASAPDTLLEANLLLAETFLLVCLELEVWRQ